MSRSRLHRANRTTASDRTQWCVECLAAWPCAVEMARSGSGDASAPDWRDDVRTLLRFYAAHADEYGTEEADAALQRLAWIGLGT